MCGISRSEIMAKISQKATNDLVEHGFVKIDGFGTLWYLKDTNEYKFAPDTQLKQALSRTGQ